MKENLPPKWAMRFFSWYCKDELKDAILGDMLELYHRRVIRITKRKADWLFCWNVLLFFQPFTLKKNLKLHSNHTAMLQHHIKITWRTLLKDKLYSSIKIGGFALGIAICLLIALFVKDELGVDRHYENAESIYRILGATSNPEDTWSRASCFPAPIKNTLLEDFPEVEKAGRLISFDGWFDAGNNLFRPSGQTSNVYEERFAYADPELIEMLQVPMVYGSQATALSQPNSILISKRKADKYYPNENPIGKTIVLNDDEESTFVIGGVMENLKSSHLSGFDFFITLSGKEFWEGEQNSWCCWNYSPYIQVRRGTSEAEMEEKLLHIRDKYVVGWFQEQEDQRAGVIQEHFSLDMQPIGDIYLGSQDVGDFLVVSDRQIVLLFMAIAVFILLLACINFINLSTAKSANRAKEVGLRKVVGSHRTNLIGQFLTESIIYSIVSVVVGVIVAWFAMPYFNAMAGKSLEFPLTEWWPIPLLLVFALVMGVISGIYPSFYLSAFKPISVLRGNISRGSRGSFLRSGLVVFQFVTSIVLIVGAFVVHRQMQYILNKNLGFDKDQVIQVHGVNTMKEKQKVFKNELLNLSEIQFVSASDFLPIKGTSRNGNSYWKEGRTKIDEGVGGQIWWVDADYIDALGMNLIEGRMLSHDIGADTASLVVNQAMVKELGLEQPIGARITRGGPVFNVIGVVEDFHYESLRGSRIEPLAMGRGDYGFASILSIRTNTSDMPATLASISGLWDKFMPQQPIRYSFMDETYARAYEDVKRTSNLFSTFAIFGIIVACLGLFGLSAFMAEQRRKEISIRKVLGASLQAIFQLLTLNFLKLVLISLVVAVPIGWYIMQTWLDDFEYRIDIHWDVFVLSGVMVVFIALITVSFESVKAAIINPANGLRSE
ncbi:MAG: FtsX-like permease family protein [Cyclobacteriaceae bacterium]